MLEKEFKYYLDHQEDLVKQYDGKFLVIVGDKVVGAYPTKIEAYNKSKEKFELGTFLVQHCSTGNQDYSRTFYSRVS
jgi:hypothetical protein